MVSDRVRQYPKVLIEIRAFRPMARALRCQYAICFRWATPTRTRLVRNFIDGYIDRKRSFISKRVGPRPRLFKILIRRPNVARSAQNTREIRKACKRDKVVSERVASASPSPTTQSSG